MKVEYDADVDVLTITLRDMRIQESDEASPGVILDYDEDGNVVGIEILNASQRVDHSRQMTASPALMSEWLNRVWGCVPDFPDRPNALPLAA